MKWGVWLTMPGDPPDTGNAVPRREWQGWAASDRLQEQPSVFCCREGAEQEAIGYARSIYRDRYSDIRVKPYSPMKTGEFQACVPGTSGLVRF